MSIFGQHYKETIDGPCEEELVELSLFAFLFSLYSLKFFVLKFAKFTKNGWKIFPNFFELDLTKPR